ncbi:hypothetical protein QFC22_001076 [Naganishia vaughanmartiniae]|uniref:Uncharacterized protein n=1 Tax=Naganishia vaughanmartiniae TaxID=1424756 RepID=A0ACC2XLM4_9TREE|nr:hypothetical protein QFC22_001076 [Naganishia vaughanmartiniae]
MAGNVGGKPRLNQGFSRGSSPRNKDDSNGSANNDDTVKEVRQKVEDLSHDESTSISNDDKQQEPDASLDTDGTDIAKTSEQETVRKRKHEDRTLSSQVLQTDAKRAKDEEDEELPVSAVPSVDMDKPDQMPREASPEPIIVAPAPAKKTQATFGSFASTTSPFAKISTSSAGLEGSETKALPEDVAAKVREANTLPVPGSKSTEPSAKETVKKSQTTFGAFSSTASPFSSIKHTSAFTSQPVASSSNATAHSASPFTPASGSAFGNWSTSGSPFATPSRKLTPKPTADDADQVEEKNDSDEKEDHDSKAKRDDKSFGDILAATSGEASAERQKLDVQHQQVPTGEEDENTIHSVRCKLYVMDAGAWKERGTGSLHLNIHKKDLSARVVMRAEGVLRLILNTPLYAGMKAELTDRYVKFPIVEEGKIHHIAIRTRNMDEATALHEAIERYIPAKDKSGNPSEEPVGEEAV